MLPSEVLPSLLTACARNESIDKGTPEFKALVTKGLVAKTKTNIGYTVTPRRLGLSS